MLGPAGFAAGADGAAFADAGVAGEETFFLEDRTVFLRVQMVEDIGYTGNYRVELSKVAAALDFDSKGIIILVGVGNA